jgi:hypothetical protein
MKGFEGIEWQTGNVSCQYINYPVVMRLALYWQTLATQDALKHHPITVKDG